MTMVYSTARGINWFLYFNYLSLYHQNTHSINCTPLTAVTAVTLLHNHLFFFIYPYVSFCMVYFFLLKPLKSNFLQFLEEAWTGQCVECKVPRELLLHTDQLMPPLEIGENWIWEVWGERNGPCRRRQKDKWRKRGGCGERMATILEYSSSNSSIVNTMSVLIFIICT